MSYIFETKRTANQNSAAFLQGYESEVEDEDEQPGELTFYSCFDNINDYPEFEQNKQNMWNSSLYEREKHLRKSLDGRKISEGSTGKSSISVSVTDDDGAECETTKSYEREISFEDSPLPLRDRMLRKSSSEESGQQILNVFHSIVTSPKNSESKAAKQRSQSCAETFHVKKYVNDDESVDPVFSSTRINNVSTTSCRVCMDKNIEENMALKDDSVDVKIEEPKSVDDLSVVSTKNPKVKLKSVSSASQLQDNTGTTNRIQVSTTDEDDADNALENFFAEIRTPKLKKSLTLTSLKTNPSNVKRGRKCGKRNKENQNTIANTYSLADKDEVRSVETTAKSCSSGHLDEEEDFIDKLKELHKLSSESEDSKEIDKMMSKLGISAVKQTTLQEDDELIKRLKSIDIDRDDSENTPKPSASRGPRKTSAPSTAKKVARKCWFLDTDRINPEQFRNYVEDFHLMTDRQFCRNREKQTRMLFTVYNHSVFNKMFFDETFQLEWNKNLTSCAGRTNCVTKKMITKLADGSKQTKETERFATIELSTKILDSADRLRDTLVHEMCHAAVWVETGDRSAGHGPLWKRWARAVNVTFDFLPLVTRCHSYAINYKFWYQCKQCSSRIGRFSKSIDPQTQVCGSCHGRLELVTGGAKSDLCGNNNNHTHNSHTVPPKTPRTPNVYTQFVKDNWSSVKKPGMSFKETQKEVSRLYQQRKAAGKLVSNNDDFSID